MFFQNVFNLDFIGVLLLADRQLSLDFKIPANTNSSLEMINWVTGPFDLSANANLTFNYSLDSGNSWFSFVVDVTTTATSSSSVTVANVVDALNANVTFADWFTAEVRYTGDKKETYVVIKVINRPNVIRERWKAYISNTSAESVLLFNKKAGVAEIPSFFERHTIANKQNYDDSLGSLIKLNTGSSVDQAIITRAGLDYSSPKADYQLLKGYSGMFMFTKNTVDSSSRITETITYSAGAGVGAFAKKTKYTYTGVQTTPDQVTEEPYVLQIGELVTP